MALEEGVIHEFGEFGTTVPIFNQALIDKVAKVDGIVFIDSQERRIAFNYALELIKNSAPSKIREVSNTNFHQRDTKRPHV